MTDQREFAKWENRIAELELWQQVDLENYKQHLAELEDMLTAATDTAVQRGKRIDAIRALMNQAGECGDGVTAELVTDVVAILDGET